VQEIKSRQELSDSRKDSLSDKGPLWTDTLTIDYSACYSKLLIIKNAICHMPVLWIHILKCTDPDLAPLAIYISGSRYQFRIQAFSLHEKILLHLYEIFPPLFYDA